MILVVMFRDEIEDRKIRAKMTALALSFHSLEGAAGVSPWDANRLDEWGAGPRSHGERCAARFVLTVWGGTTLDDCPWKSGPFDIADALKIWDEDHHAAFVSWVRNPWWP